MDDRLRELMQNLGNAINESISDSGKIAEAVDEINRAGYNVRLSLEATIVFEKQGLNPPNEEAIGRSRGELDLNSGDQNFLKALKIRNN